MITLQKLLDITKDTGMTIDIVEIDSPMSIRLLMDDNLLGKMIVTKIFEQHASNSLFNIKCNPLYVNNPQIVLSDIGIFDQIKHRVNISKNGVHVMRFDSASAINYMSSATTLTPIDLSVKYDKESRIVIITADMLDYDGGNEK